MIGETVCHYRILEELGGGGMGVVYRAEDTRLKRIVALKFLSPELTRDERAKRRFVTEAQAASQLDHPNICTIHDIEETDDGQLFLVLSCYEGETARDRLEKGPMPIDEAVGLAIHIARGLEAAHAKGIVHRDIKSANIFLTDGGRAKILDFGLAKLAGQTKVTKVGSTVGTVAYMSPEQARGGDVKTSTDIWSLGVVLYEALTGGLPFPGERPESVLYSVVHEEPEPLGALRHDVPPELEAIVDRCLKKDPAERFASATELAAALEPLKSGRASGSSLIEIGSTTRIPAEPRRTRGLALTATVLVLACAGLLALPQGRGIVRNWFSSAELPAVKQLVVLPFVSAGDEGPDPALVDGLRRHVAFRLSQLEQYDADFRVNPVAEMEEVDVTTPEAAASALGATVVLSGSVERSDDGLKMSIGLVETRTGQVLDTWECDDDLTNIAAFQLDPIIAAAEMLELGLEQRDRRTLTAGGTTVPGAFETYARGLGRLWAADDDSTDHMADAIALLADATGQDPSFALAHAELGRAHWEAFVEGKDPDELALAGESSRRAADLEKQLATPHVTLGAIKAQAEDYPAAAQEFRCALDIDPVNLEARRRLADASLLSGDFTLAEMTLSEAVDVRRHHWLPYYALGIFYYQRGRNDDALVALGKSAALAPDHPWQYILLGAIYLHTGRHEEARAAWWRSVEIEPSRAVYSNLGTSYFVESRYGDAARMYEMALELDDSHYVTWGNLASACGVIPGEEEKTAECFARALELAEEQLLFAPHDAELLAMMASYSAELADTGRARDFLKRSVELSPDDYAVVFYIGLTHEVLGDRETALEWIGRSIEEGFPQGQVESTPALRELCADDGYRRLVQRGGGR